MQDTVLTVLNVNCYEHPILATTMWHAYAFTTVNEWYSIENQIFPNIFQKHQKPVKEMY